VIRNNERLISSSCDSNTLCCSVLQYVAMCRSVLRCAAVCFISSSCDSNTLCCSVLQCVAVCRSVLRCVAVCRSVSQCVALYCSVPHCVAMCCSVSQCVAMCCRMLLQHTQQNTLRTTRYITVTRLQCNTLIYCNTLKHAATRCNTLHYNHRRAPQRNTLIYCCNFAGSFICNSGDMRHRRLIGSPKLQIISHKRAIKCRSLLRKMTYKDKGSYESSPPCISSVTTGWRRLIGCLKSQVIFRKRATNYKALLRKMTCKDKASYGSSPPCIARHVSAVIQRGS